MLEHWGYQVLTASNGRYALEMYAEHQDEIALVLADVTMPEMGGVALFQALRERNPAIKVVAMTGYPLEAEAKGLLAQGAVNRLRKPLSAEQLAQVVSHALKGRWQPQ
jgi:CheY-like chemotaxis protein